MAQTDLAAEFLSLYLPPEVAALLDFSSLTSGKDAFTDNELQTHLSDLLFRVRLKTGTPVYVFIILEHKSYTDDWVGMQTLRYMTRVLEAAEREEPAHLPFVLPVVFYHGRTAWQVSPEFGALFPPNPEFDCLRPYVPAFRYHLCDLTQYRDEELRGQPALQAVLRVLKYVFRKTHLRRTLTAIFRQLLRSDLPATRQMDLIHAFVAYLRQRDFSDQELGRSLTAATRKEDAAMETFIDRWINQGVAQGLEQGLAQGLEQGLKRGLQQGQEQGQHSHALRVAQRLAAKCLGPLPQELEAQLADLSTAQLDELCLAVLDMDAVADLRDWLNAQTVQDNELIN